MHVVAEDRVADARSRRPAARYTARSPRSHLRMSGCSIHIAPSTPPAMRSNAPIASSAAGTRRCRSRTYAVCRPGSRPVSLGVEISRVSSRAHGGRRTITDEGVERLRARIGIPEPHPMPPYYTLPTHDTFRNVAVAYGDDNPLWCDPEYGAQDALGAVDRVAGARRRRHAHRRGRGRRRSRRSTRS